MNSSGLTMTNATEVLNLMNMTNGVKIKTNYYQGLSKTINRSLSRAGKELGTQKSEVEPEDVSKPHVRNSSDQSKKKSILNSNNLKRKTKKKHHSLAFIR